VGGRGHSTGHELLLGSVAREVLHCAHRPVLVVPAARKG
jgi:nucleotide-binding universal stress UspA family protein